MTETKYVTIKPKLSFQMKCSLGKLSREIDIVCHKRLRNDKKESHQIESPGFHFQLETINKKKQLNQLLFIPFFRVVYSRIINSDRLFN